MRRSFAAFAFALAALLVAGGAGAASVPFGDSVHYWAGYGNGSSDDAKDTIGHPDIKGGSASFTGGALSSVQIDYQGPFSLSASGNGSVIPGDLFIDAGADGDWDYVVKAVSGPQTAASYGSLSVLDVSGLAPSYLLSGADGVGHWQGYGIRGAHPYAWNGGGTAIDVGGLVTDGLLSGGSHSLLFSLGAGVDVGGSFVLAFAPSCANDVIFERLNAPPVPEPGAAMLFGAGAPRGPGPAPPPRLELTVSVAGAGGSLVAGRPAGPSEPPRSPTTRSKTPTSTPSPQPDRSTAWPRQGKARLQRPATRRPHHLRASASRDRHGVHPQVASRHWILEGVSPIPREAAA